MSASSIAVRPTRIRYVILLLTVFLYMITYLDRVLLSTAIPTIQTEFGFSVVTMGWMLASYSFAYALFQIPGGWAGDRYGPRIMLMAVVLWWSAFTAMTALTWSVTSMAVCLFLFGAGEAGAFPIATRSLSRWMLPAERGFAQGATHAGSRLGGALTPIIVVFLIARFGWRPPFFLFALIGLVWAAVWFYYYRNSPFEHQSVNEGERELIKRELGDRSGRSRVSVPWRQLLSNPQIWILAAMYACYGYDMGIFLAWFPKYLSAARGFSLQQMGIFATLPLLAGVAGDLCGGWFSDSLIRRTGNITFGRRAVAISGYLIAAATIPLAVLAPNPIWSSGLFAIAVFGLELTVGNSWAVTLDIGGEYAGSVSAVMNTCGNLAGASASILTGYIVTLYGWNAVFYVLAGLALVGAALFSRINASQQLYRAAGTTASGRAG